MSQACSPRAHQEAVGRVIYGPTDRRALGRVLTQEVQGVGSSYQILVSTECLRLADKALQAIKDGWKPTEPLKQALRNLLQHIRTHYRWVMTTDGVEVVRLEQRAAQLKLAA